MGPYISNLFFFFFLKVPHFEIVRTPKSMSWKINELGISKCLLQKKHILKYGHNYFGF